MEWSKRSIVALNNLSPTFLKSFKFVELPKAKGCLQVGHVVLEPGHDDLVLPRTTLFVSLQSIFGHPMKMRDSSFLDKFWGSCEHATFGGGHVLGGIKAKCRRVVTASNEFPFVGSGNGMSGIFNDNKSVFLGDGINFVHLSRVPGIVDGNDGFRVGSDCLAKAGRIHVERVWLDINQNRGRTGMFDHIDSRAKGVGYGNDLISGTDPRDNQGKMKGGSAGIYR